jgi:hypothetical protein
MRPRSCFWPEKRLGKGTVKVTGKDSVLKIRDIEIRIPAGTPADLLANINIYRGSASTRSCSSAEPAIE